MAVVGALDLDDACRGRCWRASARAPSRVASVPELQKRHSGTPKRSARFSPITSRCFVGWAKWVPSARLLLDRLDDLRVRVAHHHGAVAQVEVDVLVLVDVPQVVALAAVDEDRVRGRVLPAGGDAAGDVAVGDLAIRDRGLPLGLERRPPRARSARRSGRNRTRWGPGQPCVSPPRAPFADTGWFERPFNDASRRGRSASPRWPIRVQSATSRWYRGERQHGGCSSARLERLVVVQEAAGSNPVTHPKTRRPGRWKARLVNCAGPLAQFGRATDS